MSCAHDPSDHSRVYRRDKHVPACGDDDCRGCRPCPKDHCTVCCIHLDDDDRQTCWQCVGQTRRDLQAILELATLLPDHALHAARDSKLAAALPIPGGDALVMLSRGSEGVSDDSETAPVEQSTPSYLLAWWANTLRRELRLRNSVLLPIWRRRPARALLDGYCIIDAHLTWAATHFPAFHLLARDLRSMRRRLERLLVAGSDPLEGVPCFVCSHTLVRDYLPPIPCHHAAEARANGLTLGELVRTYRDAAREHQACNQGGLQDTGSYAGWHCPRCKRDYTKAEYRLAVRAVYVENATALPAVDLAKELGVSVATIRQWAARGIVRRRGVDERRRTLYDARAARRHAMKQDATS